MAAVGMVQVAVHQIVDVIAVGNLRVAALRAMHMGFVVPAAGVLRRAGGRVLRRHADHMFVDMVAVNVVEVAVVKVVGVAVVLDGDMTAALAVLVGVACVLVIGAHRIPFHKTKQ
jgi:hypothetical protein